MRQNRSSYQGACTVTARHFKTPRKGYRLADITRVDLRRTHFFLLLPLLLGLVSLMMFCSELLYASEILICLLIVAVLGGCAWSIGTINLTGFNVAGMATIGLYWQMRKLKSDLDEAMEHSERSNRRRGHRQ